MEHPCASLAYALFSWCRVDRPHAVQVFGISKVLVLQSHLAQGRQRAWQAAHTPHGSHLAFLLLA